MRILLVAYFYEAAAGGGIIVARLLREQLLARGHTVDVLCLEGSPETQPGRVWRLAPPPWASRRVHRLRQTLLFLNNRAFDRWLYRRALALPLAQEKYDFVLSQDFLSVALARALAEHWEVPCGNTLHDTLPQQVWVGAPQPLVRRALTFFGQRRDRDLIKDFRKYAWLVGVSQHVRESAERWLQPTSPPLSVIYNPAPQSFANVIPPLPETALRYLFVGRLSPEKGVDLLLEAFRQVPGPHRLTILGLSGSLGPRVADLVRQDPRVTLRKAVPYSQMPGVYADHHVVCCPVMWNEPFGLTVLEGRVSQRVVIGTRRGGLPEILAGYPRARLADTLGADRATQIRTLAQALGEAPQLLRQPIPAREEAAFLHQFSLGAFAASYEALIQNAVSTARR